jgi:DNA-binding NtrC family response regulator
VSEHNAKILIVDDEPSMSALLANVMKVEGFKTLQANEGKTGLALVQSESPDLMLLDIKMPDIDGMEVLREAKDIDPGLPIIVVTGYHDSHGAVRAIKAGAYDYIGKPFDVQRLTGAVDQALSERKLKGQIQALSSQVEDTNSLKKLMGPSDVVERLIDDVNRVAGSDFYVILIGETGSGKEVVARAIHQASFRSKSPFTPVDCGSIPETLLESELFGHEKGSFTGADAQKLGKFEITQGGTLLLDEISNMPLSSQAKLLRAIQEKKIYRVGGTKPIDINVRLLAASNQDLSSLTEAGSFRRDLYYRLAEFVITIPPLRERKEDIPYLAKRFLDTANRELNKKVKGFSETALDLLFNYPWPGNVRQLRSTIRRATLLADEIITERHLDLKTAPAPGLAFTPKGDGTPWKGLSLREIIQQSITSVEREVISQVLKTTGGNKARAARLLQVDYKTIHEKVKKLGLERTKDDNGGRDKSESKAKKPGKRAMDGEEPWEDRLPLEQESEAVLG